MVGGHLARATAALEKLPLDAGSGCTYRWTARLVLTDTLHPVRVSAPGGAHKGGTWAGAGRWVGARPLGKCTRRCGHPAASLVTLQRFPLSSLEETAAPAGGGSQRVVGGARETPDATRPTRALLGILRHLHLGRRSDGGVRVAGSGVVGVEFPVSGVQRLWGKGKGRWQSCAVPAWPGQGCRVPPSPGSCSRAGAFPVPGTA